jgi:hypothetical protein
MAAKFMNAEACARLADLPLTRQDSAGHYPAEEGWEKLVFTNLTLSLRGLIERGSSDRLRVWDLLFT